MTASDPVPNVLPLSPVSEGAWVVLDRLLCDLPQRRDSAEKIRLILQAVRAGTGADAVFWYPGVMRAPLQFLGSPSLTPEWCAAFVRQQVRAGAHTQALTGACPVAGELQGPVPQSAALVRISKSRAVWLVALGFHPARLLGPADVRLMALARRFFLQDRQRVRAQEKLKGTLFGLVTSLTAAINAKNPYTGCHSERVARIAVRVGREMGLSPAALSHLHLAGLLHDVGKIGIDTNILQLAGPLDAAQRAQMQRHPVIGDEILAGVPSLAHLRPPVRHHHEHFDGSGYPDRLAGHAIPLLARILAVADGCDAMFSARPYRPGMPAERVDAILKAGAGSQWDPNVIRAFMACRQELYAICAKGLGDSVRRAASEVVRRWEVG